MTPRFARAATRKRPNILFIMVDEMRWDSMGCEGNSIVKTPNLDRIAKEGTRFSTAYTVAPICCPARKSVFTGRYTHVHGVVDNNDLPKDGELDLPVLLRHYGYNTAIAGKLHYAPTQLDWGFDWFWSYGDEGPHQFEDYPQYMRRKYGNTGMKADESSMPYPDDPLGHDIAKYNFPKEDLQAWWIADRSIEFLREQKNSNQPFFLFASFKEPHTPYKTVEPYWSMYDPADMIVPEIPEHVKEERAEVLRTGDKGGSSRHLVGDEQMVRELMAKYYGHMSNVDDNVGRLMKELKQLGLDDNTIVIFTADHGNMLGERGRWLKGVQYEGSSRIALLMRVPEKSKYARIFNGGKVVDRIVENTDIMPTLLEMADLPIPAGVQGKSFVGMATGEDDGWKDHVYSMRFSMMYRTPEYKLIRNPEKIMRGGLPEYELYDMKRDLQELNNLSEKPEYKEVVAKYAEKLDGWLADKPPVSEVTGLKKPDYVFLDTAMRKEVEEGGDFKKLATPKYPKLFEGKNQ